MDEVDLLDYCILAYQLHTQTLVLAPDPYGEVMRADAGEGDIRGGRRWRFLDALDYELSNHANLYPNYRGNVYQAANGWVQTQGLVPAPCEYDRVTPHLAGVVRQNRDAEGWIIYRAPNRLTSTIDRWYIASYPAAQGPNTGQPTVAQAALSPNPAAPPAPASPRDLLYGFEGATGVDNNGGAGWALMGFVLARQNNSFPNGYDIAIIFRGSRSGKVRLVTDVLGGRLGDNPDWATNLDRGAAQFQQIANSLMHPGFAKAAMTTFPAINACLLHLQAAQNALNRTLCNVYVTGHSLGGGLAGCFASAVGFGNFLPARPYWQNLSAAEKLAWKHLELVTFAAPPVTYSGTFKDTFNLTFPRARGYRLIDDIVPKAKTDIGHKTVKLGHITKLPGRYGAAIAHSPDTIRDCLESILATTRRVDTSTQGWIPPWRAGLQFETVLREVVGADPLIRAACYNFREGLILYLRAFKRMKAKNGVSDRLMRQEQNDIDKFISDFLAPNRQFDKITYLESMKTRFENGGSLNIGQITGEQGSVFFRTVRHWLALVAGEGGFAWFPARPRGAMHQAIVDWYLA